MKNLSLFVLTTSTLLGACSNDSEPKPDADMQADGGGRTEGEDTSESAPAEPDAASGTAEDTAGSSSGEATNMGSEDAAVDLTEDSGTTIDAATDGAMMGADASDGASMTKTFTVTIENAAPVKRYNGAGVFNTPVGETSPGPVTPGKKYEFTINAGRKQKLSFATMLAATNDLFFAPNGDGIALYDEAGNPFSGDVTEQIYLWDAGTEVNEEPKVGPNTVSKQEAPDTGPAENGNVVEIGDTTDPFDYPSVAEVMAVTVTHLAGTEFMVTIENVSTDMALQTTDGDFAAPMSPGIWVVHNQPDPLFTEGMPDRGQGVERIAEDGNPEMLGAYVADNEGLTYPASPGVWVVHSDGSTPLFTQGVADYGNGLEGVAEDGNPTLLAGSTSALTGVISSAVFNTPVGSSDPGPILPGLMYQFSFEASPGEAFSFVSMLAATNDVFFGPMDTGIALFDTEGQPLSGDITSLIYLWDAGTEANEQPGIGPNTVTNQLAPNTGNAGEGTLDLLSNVADDFNYPAVDSVLKVNIMVN